MQLRTLGTFAASFSVWIGSTAANEPFKLPVAPKTEKVTSATDLAANKQLVDAVAAKLQDSGAASDAEIEFKASGGAVTVIGTVGTSTQKAAILDVVRRVDGVKLVKDGVKVAAVKPAPQFTSGLLKAPDLTMPVAKPVEVSEKVEPAKINIVAAKPTEAAEKVEPIKVAMPVVKTVEATEMVEPAMPEAKPVEATEKVEPAKVSITSAKPVDTKAANQKLANEVLGTLRASGAVVNSDLDILASDGVVSVIGFVGSAEQKVAILEVVRRIDGVNTVKDGVQLKPAPRPMNAVMQAQAVGPYATMAPSAIPPAPMQGNPQIDPVPVGPGGGLDGAAPPLPQNAWPTYAPYNNVSRVAYPTAYPYNAFPFIGPYYPFPKVPLGWRKVTLEWEDGHWWLGRKQAPIDYWRVKFGY